MAKDLLLEIGLEEMPAHVVTPSMKQLEEKTAKFLDENQLTYDTIETFSTPRRLAIKVTNIPERQADSEEEVKGPAKKNCFGRRWKLDESSGRICPRTRSDDRCYHI